MLTFTPDGHQIGGPEMLKVVSGIPTMRGFAPPPIAAAYGATGALAGGPAGGGIVMDSSGAAKILVGADDKVQEFGSAAWTNRGTFAGRVFFIPFGTNTFAIGYATKPHTVAGSLTAITAPRAYAGDSAGYFMMLGATVDTSTGLSTSFGDQNSRWWCSHYADATTAWNPNVTTQCTTGLLTDSAGGIMGIRAMGDRFVIYKAGAMYLASYIGPPEVFGFQRISDRIGAVSQSAVVKVDATHYFIGSEDVWRYDGTGYPVSIGAGVREWLFASMDRTVSATVQGRHDPFNQLIYWHYSPVGASGAITKVLVYHYPSNRFGAFDFTVTQVFATEGGVLFATTSDGNAQKLSMSYLDASYVIKSLTGTGTTMSMTTAWIGDEERVSLCDRVKPRFGATAPTSGTLDADTCMSIGGTVTDITQVSMSSARFDILASARYHRQVLAFSGSAYEIEAIGARLKPEGDE